jgi:S-adenosylmethionine hydrolase
VKDQEIIGVKKIPIPEDASQTFHGRDVFAKAAAEIECGNFNKLGPEVQSREIKRLELFLQEREGLVVRIDRFGNVITNLPKLARNSYIVEMLGQNLQMNYYETYQAAPTDELFLIEGSCHTLEVSLKNGSANDRICLKSGDRIRIA